MRMRTSTGPPSFPPGLLFTQGMFQVLGSSALAPSLPVLKVSDGGCDDGSDGGCDDGDGDAGDSDGAGDDSDGGDDG